jgi:hypothetical protein
MSCEEAPRVRMVDVVLIDSVRRVTHRRSSSRQVVHVTRAVNPARPLQPAGQLRRTRPDLPLIDAVDGFSDFIHCPHPGCCALRPIIDTQRCPACHRL